MLVVLFMNAKKHVLYATLLLFSPAIAAWNPFEAAQTGTTSPRAELVLTLEVNKTEFVLYEPVTLVYKVENPTLEVITANVVLSEITFSITKLDGKTEEYRGSGSLACVLAEETVHEPGSIEVSEIDLGWKGKESIFPVPGVYEIRAQLYAGDRPDPVFLESNKLKIEVREPSGVDIEAIAFFASKEEFKRLLRNGAIRYCRGHDGRGCFEQIRQFIERHGSSAYMPKVVWDLAASVSTGLLDVEPQYDTAVGLYRQFLEQWSDHPNAPRVMYGLAMALDRAGRYSEAVEVILDFERKFPGEKRKATSLRTNLQSGMMLGPE